MGEEREEPTGVIETASLPAALRERFGIRRLLGSGGMGSVYLGALPGTGKPCALKVILGNPDGKAVARFLGEARLLSRSKHQNLVEVYDAGVQDGLPWIAMELLEGGDLRALLPEPPGSPPDLPAVEEVARAISGALTQLHADGIVHRDVKPGNAMRDGAGRVVLMDLGLARSLDATRLTATGSVVGTIAFLAPEVLLDEEQGPPMDWYALGVTLYLLLSGRLPYRPEEVLSMAGGERWRQALPLGRGLDVTPLGRLTFALLAREPGARPASLQDVEAVLDARDDGSTLTSLPRVLPASSASWSGAVPVLDSGATSRVRRNAAMVLAALLLLTAAAKRAWRAGEASPGPVASGGDADPAPARSEGPPPARSGDREAEPAITAAGDGSERLAGLVRDLGVVEGTEPRLALLAILARPGDKLAARADEALSRVPQTPEVRFLRFEHLLAQGVHEKTDAAALGERTQGDPVDYFDVRLRAGVLAHRLMLSAVAQGQGRGPLLEEVRRLDGWLAGRGDPEMMLARAEFWELLSRRVHLRPEVNLPLAEWADELLREVMPWFPEASPLHRVFLLFCANRIAGRTGDIHRYRIQKARYEEEAVAALADDEVRAAWLSQLREDGERGVDLPGGLVADRFLKPVLRAEWLPLPPGFPGSGQVAIPLVPDRPGPRALELAGDPRADGKAAFDDAELRHRSEAIPLTAPPAWLLRHLDPVRLVESDPVGARVLDLDALLMARLAIEPKPPAWRLPVLQAADRRRRTARGYLYEARRWYSGAPARMVLERIRAEIQVGDPDEGLSRASLHIRQFAELSGPWTWGETEAIAAIWTLLAEEFDPDGSCPDFALEAIRLLVRLLEATASGEPTPGSAARTRWLQDLGRLRARLGRTPSGRCRGRGPEPGLAIPERVFPPLGDLLEHADRLLAK